MAISFVQSTTGTSTGASTPTSTTAFASPTTSGNTIIVTAYNDTATSIGSVTDSAGNIYTKVIEKTVTTTMSIWVCYNIRGASSVVVSFPNGFNDGGIIAQEFSGLGINSFDVSANSSGTGNTTLSIGPTASTTYASELVVCGVSFDWQSGNDLSVGSGYSNFAKCTASFVMGAMESKTVSATGAQTATMGITNPSAFTWRGVVVTFYETLPMNTAWLIA